MLRKKSISFKKLLILNLKPNCSVSRYGLLRGKMQTSEMMEGANIPCIFISFSFFHLFFSFSFKTYFRLLFTIVDSRILIHTNYLQEKYT